MAFVNEVIQEKDKGLVDFEALYSPAPSIYPGFEPSEWCIDRERNAIFIRVPRMGRFGPGVPDRYALILAGNVIWAELFDEVSKVADVKKVSWTLARVYYGDGVTLNEPQIIELLKEALEPHTRRWRKAPWLADEQIDIEYRF